jgi:hypothetical protein
MAFEPIAGLGNNVVALKAVGRVSAEDYRDVLTPAVKRATAGGRKARLLLDLGDSFEGYDVGAMFADAGLGAGHLHSFEKMAVITDTDWVTGAVHLFAPLIPGDVRAFPSAQSAVAKEWVAG